VVLIGFVLLVSYRVCGSSWIAGNRRSRSGSRAVAVIILGVVV